MIKIFSAFLLCVMSVFVPIGFVFWARYIYPKRPKLKSIDNLQEQLEIISKNFYAKRYNQTRAKRIYGSAIIAFSLLATGWIIWFKNFY